MDFMLYSFDQIINHAAKWHYMYGGQFSVPITIRSIIGCGWGQGAQHSQSLQSLFAHIPGLKVVMPATAFDAKGLFISSVLDNNPVIFIEHRRLYDLKGPVPKKFYKIPLGKAEIRKKGKDITIIATSQMVFEAQKAAKELLKCKIDVKKTGRLIIADTGWKNCGIASEISSRMTENIFEYLKSPILRVALVDVPMPTSVALERVIYPDYEDIVCAAKRIILRKKIGKRKAKELVFDKSFQGPF
jgi:pyruvate dehydrogenase E1 component beta subunit